MPLTLFRTRTFTVGNLATVGIDAALSLGTLTIPLVAQELAGLTATPARPLPPPPTVVAPPFSPPVGPPPPPPRRHPATM
ncbi:hypothetical protein AEQ27_13760 [Frigoribacterium sp. RIT-PI-h]|nr:hypothetical protein AEQ27_13760 [Frigoribacterium sp. RIT-PI-h]